MKPRVTIVVVSYNTRDLLADCLRAVLATTADAQPALDVELVVVDNASVDGSATAARSAAPGATVIELADNVGFAAACNIGADAGSGTHVLLLNPDTQMRAGCVQALLDCLERHPEAGLVGGRTFSEDGAVDPHSCWGLPSSWSMFCFATGLSTAFAGSRFFDPESLGGWPRDTEREVGVVTGCLLLCTRALWERLGGMDATYFVYGEDVDFSFKARKLGYHPRITPAAELMHIRGAASVTSSAKWSMILRGKVTFMRRNWSARDAKVGIALLRCGALLRAVAARAHVPVAGPWRENWDARQDWLAGWEAHEQVPVRTRAKAPDHAGGVSDQSRS